MVDIEDLKAFFEERFHRRPRLFSAPGRVNLIGEHTDYNEGFVLPIAVDRRTFVAASMNRQRHIEVHSLEFGESAKIDLDEKELSPGRNWVKYVAGLARVLDEQGIPITGTDLVIASDVSVGSGLSSSAALEMSVGAALIALSGVELDLLQLALAAQKAEHVYVGTRCGLMDQLAAAFGKKKHALLIDCRSMERTLINLNIGDAAIVVCDTNVKHELAASAYNARRSECERAVEMLSQKSPEIRTLRDVSVEDFERYGHLLPEPVRRRAKHVVTENERTLQASEALRRSDLNEFGRLMTCSHQSLRDDYEVSCRELDIMVELALDHPGVAGARMTGGGFGGCTVNLVQRGALSDFSDSVAFAYEERTGIKPSINVVEAGGGIEF